LGHHHPKSIVNARRIACAVLLQPFEYVGIQMLGHDEAFAAPIE
jgi:hypothetical protein